MGPSEQIKHFSSAFIRGLFNQTGTDWTASYLAGLSWFPTSRDDWQARARAPNTAMLPWKLFMKTLQPLFKRWSGRWAFGVCSSTALSMLCSSQCFTVCCWAAVDLFPPCDWSKQPYRLSWMTEGIHHSTLSSCKRNTTHCSLWIHFQSSSFHDFLVWIWFL